MEKKLSMDDELGESSETYSNRMPFSPTVTRIVRSILNDNSTNIPEFNDIIMSRTERLSYF